MRKMLACRSFTNPTTIHCKNTCNIMLTIASINHSLYYGCIRVI